MKEKKYSVKLTGLTDSLMHNYNFEFAHQVKKWREHPNNKGKSVAGDDRAPAFTWIGCFYHDGKVVGWPSDNLMTMIRDAATMVVISGKKTFKQQSQSGILVNEIMWPIKVNENEIQWKPLEDLVGNEDMDDHVETAKQLGFEMFVKGVNVNGKKHIRVRPRFSNWSVEGTVSVFDDMITTDVLKTMFDLAGEKVGLSGWRPKAPKSPGRFGLFNAEVKKI